MQLQSKIGGVSYDHGGKPDTYWALLEHLPGYLAGVVTAV